MVPRSVSHYRLIEKLGSGGMGVVYKAADTRLNRTVALKLLPEDWAASDKNSEWRRRLLQEARAASALDHLAAARDLRTSSRSVSSRRASRRSRSTGRAVEEQEILLLARNRFGDDEVVGARGTTPSFLVCLVPHGNETPPPASRKDSGRL
ncbi:MAG: hypothetical protein ACRD3V_07090 [Vicinamibacteria bacterium]